MKTIFTRIKKEGNCKNNPINNITPKNSLGYKYAIKLSASHELDSCASSASERHTRTELCGKQWPSPFKELRFGEAPGLQQLMKQLAHMVTRDLASLQRGLHTHPHKNVQHRGLLQFLHALHGLLHMNMLKDETQ